MLKTKWRLAAVVASSVLVVAGCTAPTDDEGEPGQDQAAAEQSAPEEQGPADGEPGLEAGADAMSEPNLDDIPDPVAEVNGTEITKDEFVTVFEGQYQQMAMQSQMSGQEVDEDQLKEQTVESLVGTELLGQEASNRNIQASDEDVEAALVEFAETNQMSTDEFVAAMGEQGLDEDDVMSEIRTQVQIEQLVTDEFGEFEASEAELEEAYAQVQAQQEQMGAAQPEQPTELPPLDEVRGELEEQLRSQEQMEQMQTLVENLRGDADVTVHL